MFIQIWWFGLTRRAEVATASVAVRIGLRISFLLSQRLAVKLFSLNCWERPWSSFPLCLSLYHQICFSLFTFPLSRHACRLFSLAWAFIRVRYHQDPSVSPHGPHQCIPLNTIHVNNLCNKQCRKRLSILVLNAICSFAPDLPLSGEVYYHRSQPVS